MNVIFKNKGSGKECRRTIDLSNYCGQAVDKNKQATKRMVQHTEQMKKETISKQTKANKERTDHNHHEN